MDVQTGEVLAEAGTKVTAELADQIQNAAIPYVYIQTEERNVKVLSSMMVDLTAYVDCNPKDFGITELVYYPVLKQIIEEYGDDAEALGEALKKNTVLVMMMISTTWETDVSVRLVNCYRTSTESVFPDWKELSVKE